MSQENPFYKKSWFIISATVAIVIFVGNIVGNYTAEDKKTSKSISNKSTATQTRDKRKRELSKGQIESIKGLIEKDLLYIKYHKVYVAPIIWLQMDAQLKENFAAALAIYCGNANNSTSYFCDIYDKMSAKKLAKYGAWGFKVY